MNGKKILILISVLFVIVALSVAVYFYINSKQPPVVENNTFSNIIKKPIPEITQVQEVSQSSTGYNTHVAINTAVQDFLGNVSAVAKAEKEKTPLPPWDYKTTRILAYVSDVAPLDNKLDIYTFTPDNQSFSLKYINVKSTCTKEQTGSFLYNFELLDSSFDFMSVIKPGDKLSTFCLDETCTTIGKECIVIKGVKER